MNSKLYRATLIGKPNVGKSTLFNQLTGKDFSIISSERGVTRDVLNAVVKHQAEVMWLSDLAGLDDSFFEKKNLFHQVALEQELKHKIKETIKNSDLLIVVLDIKNITFEDYKLKEFVRETGLPKIICVNKVDRVKDETQIGDVYELFQEKPLLVSAQHRINLLELKQQLFRLRDQLKKSQTDSKNQEVIHREYDHTLAIIGRPNAGKSSFLNGLLKRNRSIVSETQGTTRDIVEDYYQQNDLIFKILDTAGLRKKNKIKKKLENYANQKTIHAVNQSDLTLLVVDATLGITDQDKKMIAFAFKKRKSLIIILNKWDLVQDKEQLHYYKHLGDYEPMVKKFAVLKISCKTRRNFSKLYPLLSSTVKKQAIELPTNELNKTFQLAVLRQAPPLTKENKALKIYYAVQTLKSPPKITVYINSSRYLSDTYSTYLQNFLEKYYQLEGIPLSIHYVDKVDQKQSNA